MGGGDLNSAEVPDSHFHPSVEGFTLRGCLPPNYAKEANQVKVTVLIENLQVEIDGKKYSISVKDGTIMVYSEDGVKVIGGSKLGRWLMIK